MKALVILPTLAVSIAALPSLALADGGHPEAGNLHTLAHLLWVGLPLFPVAAALLWRRLSR